MKLGYLATMLVVFTMLPFTNYAKDKSYFALDGFFLFDSRWDDPIDVVKEKIKNQIKENLDSADYDSACGKSWCCILANNNNPIDDFEAYCRSIYAFEINPPSSNNILKKNFQLMQLAYGFTFLDAYYQKTGDDSYEKTNETLKEAYTDLLSEDYTQPLTEGWYFSEDEGKNGFPKFVLWIKYNEIDDEWYAYIEMPCEYNRSISPYDLKISDKKTISVDDSGDIPRYVAVWGNQRVKEADANIANKWFTGSYNFQRKMTGKIASSKLKSSDQLYATIGISAGGVLMDGIGLLISNSGKVKETDVTLEWVPNGDGTLTAVANKLEIVNGKPKNNETSKFTLHKFYPHQQIAFYGKIDNVNVHCLQNHFQYSKTLASDVAEGTLGEVYHQVLLRCFEPLRYNPFLEEGLKKKPGKDADDMCFGKYFPNFWETLDQKKFNNAMYKSWALETFFSNMPMEYREHLPSMTYHAENGRIYLGELDKNGKPKGLVAIRDEKGNVSYENYSKSKK